MIRIRAITCVLAVGFLSGLAALAEQDMPVNADFSMNPIRLPPPDASGSVTLERALSMRRSVREYRSGPLTPTQVSQLLWAAQGITSPEGFRTAPSAGALFPLEVYLVAGEVQGVPAGIYRYEPRTHTLSVVSRTDKRRSLADAALGQEYVRESPVVLVLVAVQDRTTGKYGKRGIRYVHIEAGHAAQNVLLEAVALGLGAVPVGAFDDSAVKQVLHTDDSEEPLYLIAVGHI